MNKCIFIFTFIATNQILCSEIQQQSNSFEKFKITQKIIKKYTENSCTDNPISGPEAALKYLLIEEIVEQNTKEFYQEDLQQLKELAEQLNQLNPLCFQTRNRSFDLRARPPFSTLPYCYPLYGDNYLVSFAHKNIAQMAQIGSNKPLSLHISIQYTTTKKTISHITSTNTVKPETNYFENIFGDIMEKVD